MGYKKIIDVAYHDGSINWSKVKAAGISGAIIRAGYGKGNEDKKYKTFIKDAIAADVPVGIYWFSYAYTVEMAKKEADYCDALIKEYKNKLTLPVFFDWEYDSMNYAKKNGVNPGKTLITNMNVAFCEAMKAKGYTNIGVYYNEDYKNNYLDMSKLSKYAKWKARYTSTTQTDCDIWQYSEHGKVNGVSASSVDMNYVIDTSIFKKNSSSTTSTTKTETITKPETNSSTTSVTNYIRKEFIKDVQEILGLSQTGVANDKLLNKTITISMKTNRTHKLVIPLQKRLQYLGLYTGKIDGIAGEKFDTAVKKFQNEKVKLSTKYQDGEITAKKKTWKKLLGLPLE